jgi:hypothetical protein
MGREALAPALVLGLSVAGLGTGDAQSGAPRFTRMFARRIITAGHPKMCAARRIFRPRKDMLTQRDRLFRPVQVGYAFDQQESCEELLRCNGLLRGPGARHPSNFDSRLVARQGVRPSTFLCGVN